MNKRTLSVLIFLSVAVFSTFLLSVKIVTDLIPSAMPKNGSTTQPSKMTPIPSQKNNFVLPQYFIILVTPPKDPLSTMLVILYEKSPYISPAAWGTLFLLVLFYKGRTKSIWMKNGFDYDTFKILAKRRGSRTRIKIMEILSTPKNKHQIASELGLDWKTVDGHIKILVEYDLIIENNISVTSKNFSISKKGLDVLYLLHNCH